MSTASDLLRRARSAAGLTQAEFARRAGTSQANIAKYETGRMSPSVSTLERLLAAAGFSLRLDIDEELSGGTASGARMQKLRINRKQIIGLARKHGAVNVRVFGSVARGDDVSDSDIDLLVDYDSSHGLLAMVALKRELEALLGQRVDVAPVELLKPEVATLALSEAVPL